MGSTPGDLGAPQAAPAMKIVFGEEEPIANQHRADVFGRGARDHREPGGRSRGSPTIIGETVEQELALIGARNDDPTSLFAVESDRARIRGQRRVDRLVDGPQRWIESGE